MSVNCICIVIYIYIYKAPTIATSQDYNLNRFAYLEKVDKLSINYDR